MAEWIYFLHPPRDRFVETMKDEERAVWGLHFERLKAMHAAGTLIVAGPTLGPTNTGITIFEAEDEAAARKVMDEDPCITSGFAKGELRPFKVGLLVGREPPKPPAR